MINKKMLMTGFAILFFSVVLYETSILAMATIYPSYNNETDCRGCHGLTADRHHMLVVNGTRQCTDCHAIKLDNQTHTYYPEVIRNCLICHVGKNHTNVHHLLVQQGLFVCSDCHPIKFDNQSQTYYPYVTWDCTVCHSTVLSLNGTPPPTPTPTPPNPPTVANFSPPSPVNDIIGASRKFDISIDQIVDLIWYVNNIPVQSNSSIRNASYTNTSAGIGSWNVSVNASNINGNVTFTWTWNVTLLPPPPSITSYAPGSPDTLFSPVNDTVGSSRIFGITVDQITNIVWYINNNTVQSNNSVMGASYNNTSASIGNWSVKAIATNTNGSVAYYWIWNVTNPAPITIIDPPVGGQNGWYVNNTIYLNATDNNGIKYTNYSIDGGALISKPGSGPILKTPIVLSDGIHSIRYYSVDNLSGIEPNNTQTVKIDKTPPQITINSPVNGSNYTLNQSLIANWFANDNTSGIATATGTYSNGSVINTTSAGTKNFSVYAMDNASNTNTKNVTYYIRYNFGQFLSPINNDGSSIFKFGSTVPIKFQLTDANGIYVTNAVARLNVSKISSTVTGTYWEPYTNGSGSVGDVFIYETNGNKYSYNLATKNMSTGDWRLRVNIDDGNSYTVKISLKK